MRKLIAALAALVILAGGGALLLRDRLAGYFSAEGRRERMIRRLHDNHILVRRNCGLGEAHVDAERWSGLSDSDRTRAAEALAAYCAAQGFEAGLTIVDAGTRTAIGKWDGRELKQ